MKTILEETEPKVLVTHLRDIKGRPYATIAARGTSFNTLPHVVGTREIVNQEGIKQKVDLYACDDDPPKGNPVDIGVTFCNPCEPAVKSKGGQIAKGRIGKPFPIPNRKVNGLTLQTHLIAALMEMKRRAERYFKEN
jgi:hypothetical protein